MLKNRDGGFDPGVTAQAERVQVDSLNPELPNSET
jgi:hypothetical protein